MLAESQAKVTFSVGKLLSLSYILQHTYKSYERHHLNKNFGSKYYYKDPNLNPKPNPKLNKKKKNVWIWIWKKWARIHNTALDMEKNNHVKRFSLDPLSSFSSYIYLLQDYGSVSRAVEGNIRFMLKDKPDKIVMVKSVYTLLLRPCWPCNFLQSRMQNCCRAWIRALGGIVWWKKPRVKNLVLLSL
jgi:hypothetical protein